MHQARARGMLRERHEQLATGGLRGRVADVAGDSDDGHGLERVQPALHPPADRILARKDLAGDRLADDRDKRRALEVLRREVPASDDRDPHRLEVAGRRQRGSWPAAAGPVRARTCASPRRRTSRLTRSRSSAGHRCRRPTPRRERRRSRRTPGPACAPLLRNASMSAAGTCACMTSRPERPEAHVDGVERHEAPEQQPGARREDDSQRDLGDGDGHSAAAPGRRSSHGRPARDGRWRSTREACHAGARPNTRLETHGCRQAEQQHGRVHPDLRDARGSVEGAICTSTEVPATASARPKYSTARRRSGDSRRSAA